jgi:UDP-glucose 4-epimerase
MTNILFTGGAGHLGCHVLLPLIEQGYQTIVFDNPSSGHRSLTNIHHSSKLAAEWILEDMARSHNISHVILRSCNVAGAQAQNDMGEWHDPETHLIPRALRATREHTVLLIYGMNFPTPDGTVVRDLMEICELAAAHISALN